MSEQEQVGETEGAVVHAGGGECDGAHVSGGMFRGVFRLCTSCYSEAEREAWGYDPEEFAGREWQPDPPTPGEIITELRRLAAFMIGGLFNAIDELATAYATDNYGEERKIAVDSAWTELGGPVTEFLRDAEKLQPASDGDE